MMFFAWAPTLSEGDIPHYQIIGKGMYLEKRAPPEREENTHYAAVIWPEK